MTQTEISLDGLIMNAIATAETGVIGIETMFAFKEVDGVVSAEYSGGRVVQGFLVGVRSGSALEFRYCQIDSSGNLDGGVSKCEIEIASGSPIRIVETFEWASRAGGGKNVLQKFQSRE